MEKTILIVDDIAENLDVLNGILSTNYRVRATINGEMALKIASSNNPPDLILMDIMMPGMDGYEVCRRLKSELKTKDIPVIFVTAKGEEEDESLGFKTGAVDYITKPVSPALVLARVNTHLSLYDQSRLLNQLVKDRTAELESTRTHIISCLGKAAEYKDNETGMHVIRMSYFSRLIALSYGVEDSVADLIFQATPMHDVGKIGIPDSILLKPGRLNKDERIIMEKHPEYGVHILGNNDSVLMKEAKIVSLTHHEKWNGTGYPRGLRGDDIPLIGRIAAIADVFDALTSKRPYKEAWSNERAVNYIKNESGLHFDPKLVKSFINILPEIISIQKKFGD